MASIPDYSHLSSVCCVHKNRPLPSLAFIFCRALASIKYQFYVSPVLGVKKKILHTHHPACGITKNNLHPSLACRVKRIINSNHPAYGVYKRFLHTHHRPVASIKIHSLPRPAYGVCKRFIHTHHRPVASIKDSFTPTTGLWRLRNDSFTPFPSLWRLIWYCYIL